MVSIQQQLRRRKLLNAVDKRVFKATIFGDIITLQNTTKSATAEYYNSIGYLTQLNYRTNHRYPFSAADNYGIGGGVLASMDARKATDLGDKGYNIVFFCGGANDGPAATMLAQMIAYSTSIVNYITGTVGAICVLMPPPPRT